jgi:hypothetical protein
MLRAELADVLKQMDDHEDADAPPEP